MRVLIRSSFLIRGLIVLSSLAVWLYGEFPAAAGELPSRVSVKQHGDFVILGNTLGWDCRSEGSPPVVGNVGECGSVPLDTAPDLLWRSDDVNGTALADAANTPNLARSTAVLSLPPSAVVTHAYVYWAGQAPDASIDADILLDRPDGVGGTVFSSVILADESWSWSSNYDYFQCISDVTSLVQQHGVGSYRVGDLEARDPYGQDNDLFFAGWSMIVLYELAAEPLRQLEIWDGFEVVDAESTCTVAMGGFEIPAGGHDVKLGVLAYEGDHFYIVDQLWLGLAPLGESDAVSDALNPPDNLFNGTRSYLGSSGTMSGDLPQLAGTFDTMGGMDIDVFDVSSRFAPGQSEADVEVISPFDTMFIGAFVLSATSLMSPISSPNASFSRLKLHPCVPNPFNPNTTIAFESSGDRRVSLRVYDVMGRLIDVLLDDEMADAGRNEVKWRGTNLSGKTVAAGVYYCRLEAGSHSETKKMVLAK